MGTTNILDAARRFPHVKSCIGRFFLIKHMEKY